MASLVNLQSGNRGNSLKKMYLIFIAILLTVCYIYATTIYYPSGYKVFLKNWNRYLKILGGQEEIYREDLSFVDAMKNFPWNLYSSAIEFNNTPEIKRFSDQLLLTLVSFLKRSPNVPINESCKAPPIKISSLTRPTCDPLGKARKVGILWKFGFDVDALEIHLNELDDLVDKFFVVESVQAHNSFTSSKPLIWELLKYDERFAKFSEKIVHFIIDDMNLSGVNKKNIWSRENLEMMLRWQKFLEWNNYTKYFTKNDILGFGDVDEVPSRENVFFLKNCKFYNDRTDIGIWFPFDGINTVFKTDFPVGGHKFTLGDPTFWTLEGGMRYFNSSAGPPSNMRGKSQHYLLGGMHLSRYAYPPFQMTKPLTATEAVTQKSLKRIVQVGKLYAENKSRDAEAILNSLPKIVLQRIKNLTEFIQADKTEASAIVKLPWFLQCNRKRYPGFEKLHDSRMDPQVCVLRK